MMMMFRKTTTCNWRLLCTMTSLLVRTRHLFNNNNNSFSNLLATAFAPNQGILHSRSFGTSPKSYRRNRFITLRDGSQDVQYRADRVLSHRMLDKSRTQCQALLKQKRIFRVVETNTTTTNTTNNTTSDNDDKIIMQLELVTGFAHKLRMSDRLLLDKKHEIPLPPPILSVYHKPKWVLSVRSDYPLDRPTIANILPHMHPVGRLDYDSSGLLLFSSNGALTQRLLHPKHEIEKEYEAVVTGSVNAEELAAKLNEGVQTGEGMHTATLVSTKLWNDDNDNNDNTIAEYLQAIKANLPAEYNQTDLAKKGYLNVFDATALSTVRLVVTEGKYRMVRRILANCGHPVVSLRRERLGNIRLFHNNNSKYLPEGASRQLSPDETMWAESLLPNKEKLHGTNNNKSKKKRKKKKQAGSTSTKQ